jgi:GNAT superfamily N-acetyltransferase
LKKYTIREVDTQEIEVRKVLCRLHKKLFPGDVDPDFSYGHWWIVYNKQTPVAFAGMYSSKTERYGSYLIRSGVMPKHRGQGLQRQLIQCREEKAKKIGYNALVTDTTGNIYSSNNLIAEGFRLFKPHKPWAFPETLYWRKEI